MNSRCSALELAPWANRGGLLDAGLPREAVLPALNHGFGHARPHARSRASRAHRTLRNMMRAPDVLMRGISVRNEGFEPTAN